MLLFLAIFLAALTPSQTSGRPGTLAGQVLGTSGAPVANLRVTAIAAEVSGSERSLASLATTDSQGRYRLEGLPPGRYLIGGGPLSGLTYFPGTTVRMEATAVTVTNGAAITDINFRLMDILPAGVSGRVVLEDGQPAAGQTLQLVARESIGTATFARLVAAKVCAPLPCFTVRADGSFDFPKTAPGEYFAVVAGSERPLLLVGGGDSSIAVEGRDVTGLEMIISTPVYVVQSIRVEDGSPVPPLDLLLSDLQIKVPPPITRKGFSSLAGTLYTGDYSLTVSGLPARYFVKSMTTGNVDLTKQPLRVRPSPSAMEFSIILGLAPK